MDNEQVKPALEPREYFEDLKNRLQTENHDNLVKHVETLQNQIILAHEIGQKNFLHKLSFAYRVVEKELIAIANGYTTYVLENDVKAYIDKVEPKNSVKIIELERFPRAIPIDVLEKIKQAQALNIFDLFVVVFTDLTNISNDKIQSEAEKAYVARNRDPIIFGIFSHEAGSRYDKFYFIADWEDEYCDLTFSKMIQRMSEMGISQDASKELTVDELTLNSIVDTSLEEMSNKPREFSFTSGSSLGAVIYPETFIQRIKKFLWPRSK